MKLNLGLIAVQGLGLAVAGGLWLTKNCTGIPEIVPVLVFGLQTLLTTFAPSALAPKLPTV